MKKKVKEFLKLYFFDKKTFIEIIDFYHFSLRDNYLIKQKLSVFASKKKFINILIKILVGCTSLKTLTKKKNDEKCCAKTLFFFHKNIIKENDLLKFFSNNIEEKVINKYKIVFPDGFDYFLMKSV